MRCCLLGGGGGELLLELHDAAAEIGVHAVDAGEGGFRAALALFEAGELGDGLRGGLLRRLARFAMAGEGGFEFALLRFGGGVLGFEARDVFALALHQGGALIALVAIALAVELPVLQAALQALGFGLHLAQRGALVGAVALGGAAVFVLRFEQARLLGEGAAERCGVRLCLRELDVERIELLLRIAQLALDGERTFRARLAAGDGDVVEALAGGREEEGARIFECERARGAGVGRDVALAQLGQDGFERCAEAVEHADAVLQAHDAFAAGLRAGGLGGIEGELGLRIVRMDEEGGAAIDIALQQAHAFVGGVPAFDDDVVELVAQIFVDDGFVLAVDFKEVGERADGGEASAASAGGVAVGAEELADGVGGVAVLADEAFERVAAAGERGVLGAKRVAAAAGLGFFGAGLLDLGAEREDLLLEARERFGDGFELQRCLTALCAEIFEIAACGVHLAGETLGFALERAECLFGLRCLVARVGGFGEELQAAAALGFQALLGVGDGLGGFACLLLQRFGLLAEACGFGGGGFEEAAVLLALGGEAVHLLARLIELRGAGGGAGGEVGDALLVGVLACAGAFQIDGGLAGARAGFLRAGVELVAAGDGGGVLGVERFDVRGGGVDLRGEGGDLVVERDAGRVHLMEAAGEDDAQAAAQLIAHGGVALGLGGLALERVHLPRDLFEDVVHAREILLGRFEAQLGETLLGLEAGDAGGLFDDGAAVVRLGAEKLADALLLDDGVALRAEAGAHEDVLNIAQAAELAVEQIFAVAGAEEAAGDDDLAGARGGALEFAAADL